MTAPAGVTWRTPREALMLFLRGVTLRTALPTAVIVGSILSAVNQGDVILGGRASGTTWLRIAVNYLVPFAVASIGFLSARKSVHTPPTRGAAAKPGMES